MLEAMADQVWVAEDTVRVAGAGMPARMTVVRLPNGGLWVHSPLAARTELLAAVRGLGPVRHVVAPNAWHHLFIADWSREFPDAELWTSPGLAAKRPDLAAGRSLAELDGAEWRSSLHAVSLSGAPKLSETVFFHEPSRTLVCADLVFNIVEPKGIMLGLMLRLAGTHGRLALSRLIRSQIEDKSAWTQSLDQVLELPIQQLVPGHGARVTEDAHARLAEVLRPGLGTAALAR